MYYYENKNDFSQFFQRLWLYLKSQKIGIIPGTLILIFAALVASFFVFKTASRVSKFQPPISVVVKKPIVAEEPKTKEKKPEFPYYYKPGPISMKLMKTKGCVADGILSGYGGDTGEEVDMINRSECVYLHRALETWNKPPDFEKASEIMERIKKPGVIYGMFLSESIRRGSDFLYSSGDRNFNFSDMCQEGSDNVWGYRTCKASLNSIEYRKYIKYITRKAMDLGIQSFLFGQIYYQDDAATLAESKMPGVIKDMRDYANEKGIQIAIGAQTGSITDEKYLRLFDYIEGGVGMGNDGIVENGPCWSYKESCWALLWNDRYAKKAHNVLLHFDWSGLSFDDMSVFIRMDKVKRAETLKKLYAYFTAKNMGFLMPMMATINKGDEGCQGPKKRLYSASDEYTCQDEGIINTTLKSQ
jgi:hypothetical protein